jgi:PKD repeat protein
MNATGCNSASASGRIPVFAFHSTTPVINYTSAVSGNLTISFTSSLSANVDSVLWDFGYGTASSTDPNPTHTFPSSQSYLITLTAFSGSCVADTTKAIFVPVGGLNDNVYTNLSVYPNPSNGNFRIEADDIQGEVEIQIISMTGETVYNEKAVATRNKLIHDVVVENISGGTYLLKIMNDEILINGRIVLE